MQHNRDLRAEVAAGRFREDLYFRLAVIPIHIPPLRERREDVLPLARHFLTRWNAELGRELRGWSRDVEQFLLSHDWPGNVRELENAIERGVGRLTRPGPPQPGPSGITQMGGSTNPSRWDALQRMDSLTRLRSLALLTLLALVVVGCASGGSGRGWQNRRPYLYPNDHYREVGAEAAQMDIAQCMAQADLGAPPESNTRDAAVNTLGGAAGGAALGAIGGAIAGNAGTGAATGAAVGAAAGAGKTVYDKRKPSETYQGYVEACLRDKGYEVIGWK